MLEFRAFKKAVDQTKLPELANLGMLEEATDVIIAFPSMVTAIFGDVEIIFTGILDDDGGLVKQLEVKKAGETLYKIDNLDTDAQALVMSLAMDLEVALESLFDGDDMLTGSKQNDILNGFAGNDFIDGKKGKDDLTGGLNNDSFAFSVSAKKKHADTILDFVRGEDTVVFDNNKFKKLKKEGDLKKKHFEKGKADDSNDYVLYKNGKVRYDKDGDGNAKAKLVAIVEDKPNLNHNDFAVLDI